MMGGGCVVTRKKVEENRDKLQEIYDLVFGMMELHNTALFSYRTDGVDKYLPSADIDALIAKYQTMKTQLQTKIDELL